VYGQKVQGPSPFFPLNKDNYWYLKVSLYYYCYLKDINWYLKVSPTTTTRSNDPAVSPQTTTAGPGRLETFTVLVLTAALPVVPSPTALALLL
jgi:hypothetical protein